MIPIITITTTSSTSENPPRRVLRVFIGYSPRRSVRATT
jgi:hypothetical protein